LVSSVVSDDKSQWLVNHVFLRSNQVYTEYIRVHTSSKMSLALFVLVAFPCRTGGNGANALIASNLAVNEMTNEYSVQIR
jgi:hypothetical protein